MASVNEGKLFKLCEGRFVVVVVVVVVEAGA